ncbi:hypothetical protein [Pseudomonas brassicacearum]|nr:hypothetical protein [Pseudomonas brassicacearum]
MTETVAGGLQITLGFGKQRIMLGELDEPSQDLEGTQDGKNP